MRVLIRCRERCQKRNNHKHMIHNFVLHLHHLQQSQHLPSAYLTLCKHWQQNNPKNKEQKRTPSCLFHSVAPQPHCTLLKNAKRVSNTHTRTKLRTSQQQRHFSFLPFFVTANTQRTIEILVSFFCHFTLLFFFQPLFSSCERLTLFVLFVLCACACVDSVVPPSF